MEMDGLVMIIDIYQFLSFSNEINSRLSETIDLVVKR